MSTATEKRPDVVLHPTSCAICATPGNADELYPANFDTSAFNDVFNAAVFSARRLPDRIHYRMVKCRACGLVRSDPVADGVLLARLYKESSFDYGDEVAGLQRTYGHYLERARRFGAKRGALLEIGCGNGFFLEEALRQNYPIVRGVEPSALAVAQAAPAVQPHIVCDMMRPGLFEPKQFDVVCLFQVFDHIPDPAAMLDECWNVLKPGGFVICLNHNIAALSARLLGERSPIVDVEHTYLYSPATIARIFKQHRFRTRHVGAVRNNYSLHYLTRLLPLPAALKQPMLSVLGHSAPGRLRLWAPLGNLFILAQKPR